MIKILFGEEPYLIDKYIQKYISGIDSWNISYFEEFSNEVFEIIQQYPFMSNKRIVIIKMKTLGNCDKFLEYLDNPVDSSDLIVSIETVDKRTTIYKKCKTLNLLQECNKLNEGTLRKFVGNQIKKRNGMISEENYVHFVRRIGYLSDERVTLYDVERSLQQLLFSSKEITKELINLLVEESFHEKVFILSEQLFNRNAKCLYENLEKFLIAGESPIAIISFLIRHFRIQYKKALYSEKEDISRILGIPEYQLKQMDSCTKDQAERALELLQEGINLIKNGNDGRIVTISSFSKILTILS